MFDTIKSTKEITIEQLKKLIYENFAVFGEIEINKTKDNSYDVIDRDCADVVICKKGTKLSKEDKDMSTLIFNFITNNNDVIVLIKNGWSDLHVGNLNEFEFLFGLIKTKIIDLEVLKNES